MHVIYTYIHVIFICMYIFIYIYIYICIHSKSITAGMGDVSYMHRTYTYLQTYACHICIIHVIFVCTYIFMYIHIYIHSIYSCIYIYIYIHSQSAHVYIYIYIHSPLPLGKGDVTYMHKICPYLQVHAYNIHNTYTCKIDACIGWLQLVGSIKL